MYACSWDTGFRTGQRTPTMAMEYCGCNICSWYDRDCNEIFDALGIPHADRHAKILGDAQCTNPALDQAPDLCMRSRGRENGPVPAQFHRCQSAKCKRTKDWMLEQVRFHKFLKAVANTGHTRFMNVPMSAQREPVDLQDTIARMVSRKGYLREVEFAPLVDGITRL